MTDNNDDELERIKQRKLEDFLQAQKKLEWGVCPIIPKGIIHMGSCEAFSQIFNKYPETPIVIYLHAEWCAPCHTVGPVFDKLAQKYAGQVFFMDADVDQCKDIMTRFKAMSVPSFLVFHRWTERYRLTGSQSFSALENLVQKALALLASPA